MHFSHQLHRVLSVCSRNGYDQRNVHVRGVRHYYGFYHFYPSCNTYNPYDYCCSDCHTDVHFLCGSHVQWEVRCNLGIRLR